MLIREVKKLVPIDRLFYFIKERESVRLKKEADKRKPWTDDEILQRYRFCNVRRMDDKVSWWLYRNWYEPNYDHANALIACAVARFFNKPDSLAAIYYPGSVSNLDGWLKNAKKVLRNLKMKGETVFNGAYMVRGNDGMDKIECVLDHYIKPLIVKPIEIDRTSMQANWEKLKGRYGFGSFMAGQVIADLRWHVTNQWIDAKTWAPMGPGSKRGMNRLHKRDLHFPLNQKRFEPELASYIKLAIKELPRKLTSHLAAIDYQNCLCEFDKYERTLFDNRRPKQRYNGVA